MIQAVESPFIHANGHPITYHVDPIHLFVLFLLLTSEQKKIGNVLELIQISLHPKIIQAAKNLKFRYRNCV